MVIKKQDGTNFELKKPNPLMAEQDLWDTAILHNMDYADKVTYRQKKEERNDLVIVPVEIEQPIRQKVFAWCLPAKMEEIKDELYGETKRRIRYLPKFSFEVVIIKQEDLYCQFWTNSVPMESKSIIYIPDLKTWWRTERVESIEDGIIIHCHPSDQTPSF